MNVWLNKAKVLAERETWTCRKKKERKRRGRKEHVSLVYLLTVRKIEAEAGSYLSGWLTEGSKSHRLTLPEKLVQSETHTHRKPGKHK